MRCACSLRFDMTVGTDDYRDEGTDAGAYRIDRLGGRSTEDSEAP
jgi:hypothetical protein